MTVGLAKATEIY